MRRVFIVASLVSALTSGTAFAQSGDAPPGNSGIDEYIESYPGPVGNETTGSDDGARGSPLSPRARRRLEDQGAEGESAARLADRTAPGRDASRAGSSRGRPPAGGGDSGAEPGGAPVVPGRSFGELEADESAGVLPSLRDALFDPAGGGLGAGLPILLAAGLIAAVAARIVRRRHRGTSR